MDTRDYFIEAIIFLLKKKKKAQVDIARFMEVDPSQVSSFMNKKKNLSEAKREKIAEFFDKKYIDMLILGKKIVDKNFSYNEMFKSEIKKTSIENPTIKKHQEIITEFKAPEEGLAANQALLKIEKHNKKLFYRTVGDLKYMANELEGGQEPIPLIDDTPTITKTRIKKENEPEQEHS